MDFRASPSKVPRILADMRHLLLLAFVVFRRRFSPIVVDNSLGLRGSAAHSGLLGSGLAQKAPYAVRLLGGVVFPVGLESPAQGQALPVRLAQAAQ